MTLRRPTPEGLIIRCLLTVVLVTGCGQTDAIADDPYRADLEAALERATSEFEREVLRDLRITRAEYEEAVERYVQCANDRGVELTKIPQGGYYVYGHPAIDDADAILDDCRIGTVDLVEHLYVDMLVNPDKTDFDMLVVKCLLEKGLAPEGYTTEEHKRLRETATGPAPDYPFDTEDSHFSECMANPSSR